MASVNSNITVSLSKDEKRILEEALKIISDIADDARCSDVWADEESVFYCLKTSYKEYNGHLPTIVEIYE